MRNFLLIAGVVAGMILYSGTASADVVLSEGTRIVFPDGTTQSTVPDVPAGHGGLNNTVSGTSTYVGGGRLNTATGNFSTIGAGRNNQATDSYSAVGGGKSNKAIDYAAVVSGGVANEASHNRTTVGGGGRNTASAPDATVGGGYNNTASGDASVVLGGDSNTAIGAASVIGGGTGNVASGLRSTVGGGKTNTASGGYSTVAGGLNNQATIDDASVGGGRSNLAGDYGATVAGGRGNEATDDYATVAGGRQNTASGRESYVGGGLMNVASGRYATVPGGYGNTAAGLASFAAGYRAVVTSGHSGAILFADQNPFDFTSVSFNEFAVRATGGVRFVTSVDGVTGDALSGVFLGAGGTSWQTISASERKENFEAIDPVDVARTVSELPLTRWNYKHQDESVQHIGPMAEDFHAAFGLNGEYNGTIATQDIDGVALAAIQGLHRMIERQDAEWGMLDAEDRKLNKRLKAVEARLAVLQR